MPWYPFGPSADQAGTLRLVYRSSTDTIVIKTVQFSPDGLSQITDCKTLLGATATIDDTPIVVPKVFGDSNDATTLVLQLLSAVAPLRVKYDANSSDAANPRLCKVVTQQEAYDDEIRNLSSGSYFLSASTADSAAFGALCSMLRDYLWVFTQKDAAKLELDSFGITEITPTDAPRCLRATVASACTSQLAYARSADDDARWINAVFLTLQTTLLPFVSCRYDSDIKITPDTNSTSESGWDDVRSKFWNDVQSKFTKFTTDSSFGHNIVTLLKKIKGNEDTFFVAHGNPPYKTVYDALDKENLTNMVFNAPLATATQFAETSMTIKKNDDDSYDAPAWLDPITLTSEGRTLTMSSNTTFTVAEDSAIPTGVAVTGVAITGVSQVQQAFPNYAEFVLMHKHCIENVDAFLADRKDDKLREKMHAVPGY